MTNIQLTTDSTCDISKELLEKHNIACLPLAVITNDEHLDQVDLFPNDIFEYVKATKKLPKTAARSIYDFEEFFRPFVEEGKEIIHIGIGNDLSSCMRNALLAAQNLGTNKIHIIDSATLSAGSSLLLLAAAELIEAGKTVDQIVETITERANFLQTSFVVDTLEYLYRGGRCSALAMLGANILKIKPKLQVVDGKIQVAGKYMGKPVPVFKRYIDETLAKYPNPDKKRCFMPHSPTDPQVLNEVVEYVKSKNIFDEVIPTDAGATISSHCGPGTIGFIYINDGDKR